MSNLKQFTEAEIAEFEKEFSHRGWLSTEKGYREEVIDWLRSHDQRLAETIAKEIEVRERHQKTDDESDAYWDEGFHAALSQVAEKIKEFLT